MERITEPAPQVYYGDYPPCLAKEKETNPHVFDYFMRERKRLREFANKVLHMRTLQKQYFATRDNVKLSYARAAEREIDELLNEIIKRRDDD
jgi:hypothetical protein